MLVKFLLVGACAVALGFAQGGGKGGGKGGDSGGGGGAPRLTNQESITQKLLLDKDQKKQFKSLMDETAKTAAPLRESIVKTRTDISAAVAAGKSPDEIGKLVESYSLQKAQMAQLELKAFAGVFKALSPEQKQRPCPSGGTTAACSARVFEMFAGIFMKKNWDSE